MSMGRKENHMDNKTVFVIDKKHTLRQNIALVNHNMRKVPPSNADRSKEHLNIYSDKDVDFKKEFWEMMHEASAKVHKNSVYSIEIVASASREAMQRIEDEGKLQEWLEVTLDFIKKKFGEKNLVYWALHRDELTTHLHAVSIPLAYRESGRFAGQFRLSSTEFIGQPWKLRKLQDGYADAVSQFGLTRGIVDSDATHEETKIWRGKNRKLDEIELREDAVSKRESECSESEINLKSRETRINSQEDEFAFKYSKSRKEIESIAERVKKHNADVIVREKLVEQNEKELIKIREEISNLISLLQSRISHAEEVGADYDDVDAELNQQKSKLNNLSGPGF